MSKYIDEIINDIKTNPTNWRDNSGQGLIKDSIKISKFGNSPLLSIIDVHIDNSIIPSTYLDNFKLERCIKNWYKTISLNHLTK